MTPNLFSQRTNTLHGVREIPLEYFKPVILEYMVGSPQDFAVEWSSDEETFSVVSEDKSVMIQINRYLSYEEQALEEARSAPYDDNTTRGVPNDLIDHIADTEKERRVDECNQQTEDETRIELNELAGKPEDDD